MCATLTDPLSECYPFFFSSSRESTLGILASTGSTAGVDMVDVGDGFDVVGTPAYAGLVVRRAVTVVPPHR